MNLFIGSLVGGLTLGGTIALIALGLVLAFRATSTFNFAQGELMLLPAFIVGFGQTKGISLFVLIPGALVICGLVGVAFFLLALRRTVGVGHDMFFKGLIATFGLAAVLDGVMGMAFPGGSYSISIPAVPTGSLRLAGVSVSAQSLTIAGITLALALLVTCVVHFTHLGVKVRAAGQSPVLASQGGIAVRRLYVGSWAAAAVLAGVAGTLYGSSTIVNTSMISVGLVALPAVMFAGLDSIEGAMVGGIAFGMVQSFTGAYLGGRYVNVITFTLLLLILLFYPQGIFGTKEAVRA